MGSIRPSQLIVGTPWRRQALAQLLKTVDLTCLTGAFVIAAVLIAELAKDTPLKDFLSIRLKVENFALFLGLLVLWRFSFAAFSLYDPNTPLLAPERFRAAAKAIALNAAFVAVGGAAFDIEIVTFPFLLAFTAIGGLAVLGTRYLFRAALLTVRARFEGHRNALVLGTGSRAIQFARMAEGDPESGWRIVGFVDDHWAGMEEFRQSGYSLVSDLKNLPSYLRSNVVDELVVALPLEALQLHRRRLIALCREHGVNVRFLSSIFHDPMPGGHAESFGDVLMTVFNGTVEGWPLIAKRVVDLVAASCCLIVLAPVFFVVPLLIKLSSPGPAFFAQERMGINKRLFRMLKFRTMISDAEERLGEVEHLNEADGPVFKISEDPRVTRLGAILRKWSIDELPQLINVVRGEMSLVGPRPLPLRDVDLFEEDQHRRRFSVRPGITGLSQVSGRSDLPFELWMEYDLRYVNDWSLGLDLEILVKTVPAVLARRGAK